MDENKTPTDREQDASSNAKPGPQHTEFYIEFDDDSRSLSTNKCAVCQQTISSYRSRCSDHELPNTGRDTDDGWWISHIALAIVPGATALHAAALASSALSLRDGAAASGEDFALFYDFDDPSETLTNQWNCELPESVEVESRQGRQLIDTAKHKTSTNENARKRENSDPEAYVFDVYGDPYLTASEISNLVQATPDSDPLWVVPAVLYYRKQSTTTAKQTKDHLCIQCGYDGGLVFDGYVDHPTANHEKAWKCPECETVTAGLSELNL